MLLDGRFGILLWCSIGSTLTLGGKEIRATAANLSFHYEVDTRYLQIAPLPPKPLTWWIGGQNFSATLQLSVEPDLPIRCDASRFGRPARSSCREAWEDIPSTIEMQTFGDRGAGDIWNVPLPFRFISRSWSS